MTRRGSMFVSLAAAGVLSPVALAAKTAWDAPLGGDFGRGRNWQLNHVPGTLDAAQFNLSSAYTVSFTANRTSSQLLIGNDKVVFDLAGHQYNLRSGLLKSSPTKSTSAASIMLGLRKGDIARMTLDGGTLNAANAIVGSAAGSTGNVSVTGGVWNTTGRLEIGTHGNGGLTIVGGQVNSMDAWIGTTKGLKINPRGNVALAGSTSALQVNRNLLVGNGSARSGTIGIVAGANLGVGNLLDIRKGGVVNLSGGTLSAGSINRVGTLNFTGGTLELTRSNLLVGNGGLLGNSIVLGPSQHIKVLNYVQGSRGSLLSLNGGTFAADLLTQNGELRLGGGTSLLRARNMANTGLIQGGGLIDVGGLTNTGQIVVFGPESLTITGPVDNVAGGGRILLNGGSAIFGSSFDHEGLFDSAPGASATFQGDVLGYGNFAGGGSILFEKVYNPGSIGTVTPSPILDAAPLIATQSSPAARVSFGGAVNFGSAGDLVLDVGSGSADRVDVAGALHLNAVDIHLSPGFFAETSRTFTLATASNIDYGGPINLPSMEGLSFDVSKGSQALTLMVTVVPEPGTGVLVLAGAGALCLRRRRHMRRCE